METLTLYLLVCLASCKSLADTITVQGMEGQTATIPCKYSSEYKANAKYFCRGNCKYTISSHDLIKTVKSSEDVNITDGRYSLYDNKSAALFTVTISDLKENDSGDYHCALDIYLGTDIYNKIRLDVIKATTTPSRTSSTTSEEFKKTSYPTSSSEYDSEIGSASEITNDFSSIPYSPSLSSSNFHSSTQYSPTNDAQEKEYLIIMTTVPVVLILFLLVATGIYCAKMKKTKQIGIGEMTSTLKKADNIQNGTTKESEPNSERISYSEIKVGPAGSPVYGNMGEATMYSTVKCDKQEPGPSITYTTVSFAESGTSADPVIYSTVTS